MTPGERAMVEELVRLMDTTPMLVVFTREAVDIMGPVARDYIRLLQDWTPQAKAAVSSARAMLAEQQGEGLQ